MERRTVHVSGRTVRTVIQPVPRLTGDDALTSIQTPHRHIVKEGDKWVLYSKDGKKKLGTFDSKEAALKHEAEVEYFKNKDKGD